MTKRQLRIAQALIDHLVENVDTNLRQRFQIGIPFGEDDNGYVYFPCQLQLTAEDKDVEILRIAAMFTQRGVECYDLKITHQPTQTTVTFSCGPA